MGIQRDEDSLLIADTLVVVFSGEGKELIGLDAYANQEHWRRSASMKLPEISGVGRVCLVEDLAGGRRDMRVKPIYTYSNVQDILEIALSRVRNESQYYRVSNRLIVGICGAMLASLFLQGLRRES
jgi:hypothetical protein